MTTKVCPYCRSDAVVALRSINRKICADCKREFDWNLDPGQKPLLAPKPLRAVARADGR